MPADLHYRRKVEKTKRTLDYIVYAGSGLEIAVASITLLTHFGLKEHKYLLAPVEYMMTAIVVMTAAVGGLFLWLKHYEKIMYNLAMFQSQTKNTLSMLGRMKVLTLQTRDKISYSYNYASRSPLSLIRGLFARNKSFRPQYI
jgi:hypothetical protein